MCATVSNEPKSGEQEPGLNLLVRYSRRKSSECTSTLRRPRRPFVSAEEVEVARGSPEGGGGSSFHGYLGSTRERGDWQTPGERGPIDLNRRSEKRAGESAVRRNRVVECGDVRKEIPCVGRVYASSQRVDRSKTGWGKMRVERILLLLRVPCLFVADLSERVSLDLLCGTTCLLASTVVVCSIPSCAGGAL